MIGKILTLIETSIQKTKLPGKLNHRKRMKAAALVAFIFLLTPAKIGPNKLAAEAKEIDLTEKSTRPACPFIITQAKPYPALTRLFAQQPVTNNWSGGDAAYSIVLRPGRTLWLFGDSLIGTVKGNTRSNSTMVHNAIAIEESKSKAPGKLTFFYGTKINKSGKLNSAGFFPCPDPGDYYWPGDGFIANGKLYLFMHVVRTDRKLAAPFQFELRSDHLLTVSNPQDSPDHWRCQIAPYNSSAKRFLYGSACIKDNKYAYIFCTNGGVSFTFFKHPVCLGRIALNQAENLPANKLEWWSDHWRPDIAFLDTLFEDGASEMSVTKIEGLSGYFAFYIPADKQALMMRHAPKVEGPWSRRQLVFCFPKGDRQIFYYSAKAHPQYLKSKGEIVTLRASQGQH